jgi:hypothetical protein
VLTSCLLVWHASLPENRSPHGRGRPRLNCYWPCSSRNFSTSNAAMQPLPAAVIACR